MRNFLLKYKIIISIVLALICPLTAMALIPLSVNQGGTGLNTISSGRILFGNGTSPIGNNADLTWDNSGKILNISGDVHFPAGGIRTIEVEDQNIFPQPGDDMFFNGAKGNGSGAGGNLIFNSGAGGDTGNGGQVVFNGGNGGATSGIGGNIIFAAGHGTGGGADGVLGIGDPTSGLNAFLDTTLLTTSDKTFTFPDKNGTFAMTSDLHSAVTLAGENYLTLSGQQITANAVNLSGTNATGTLAAGRFPALTGDITTSVGSLTATLASVITAGGPTGSATVSPIITYDAKGRLTAVSSATITPAASSVTGGAALTKTDDTNVTLTLGGSPSTSLLSASSLTLGWTGTLSGTRGGTGVNNGAKTFTYLKNISLTSADDTGVYTLPTGTKTLLAADGSGTSLTGIPYTLTGTANQVILSAGTGNITFSLPQSIATSSNPQFATIELGAASDTTLARVGAGQISVEGVNVVTTSSTDTLTNKTLTTPVINGTITGTGQATAATASTIMMRDSNANTSVNNIVFGFTTTATAAGTTTMTVAATGTQVWTGSSTQTVKLPTTSVLQGQQYQIINQSSGAVTVQSSGANTITILAANTSALFTAVVAAPTTAANWSSIYSGQIITSGKSLSVSNTLTVAGTDSTTMTFPTTSATIARTDAGNTFTGHQTIEGVTSTGATGTGQFVFDTAPTITTSLTMANAANFIFNTSTGTKIGTGTTQKLAFYNSAPIVQPTGDVITGLQNLGLIASATITATTNANLTGPITSVGNATSIASQTGTGTKFVVDTSPTIVTPTFTTNFTSPIWKPAADSTTAIQITKADGTTGVIDIDTTNIRFGIFGTPTSKFEIFTSNTNTEYAKLTKNSGTGTAGGVAWLVTNDAAKTAEFGVRGSAQAAYGSLAANNAYMYTASDFMIMADSPGIIKFAAGGNTEIMRVTGTGLGIGMTPVKTLDVTGTFGLTGHATIEGVTSTGATGTGKFVFDTSPTFTTSIATSTDALFNMKNTIVFRDTTNGRPVVRVIPTGTLTTNPTNLEFFGTDYIADATNYERLILKSAGSSETNYVLATNAGGTGTVRGLQLTTGSNSGIIIDNSGRVGVGMAPSTKLTVLSSSVADGIFVQQGASSNQQATFGLKNGSGTTKTFYGLIQAANDFLTGTAIGDTIFRTESQNFFVSIDAGSTVAAVFKTGNVFKIAGTAVRATTEGTNHLDIFDGTAPAGTLANGISLYSTSGELRVMDSAGNATLLSPHEKGTNNWIYDSKETTTGRRLVVQMELMTKKINELLGGGFVQEYKNGKQIISQAFLSISDRVSNIEDRLFDTESRITSLEKENESLRIRLDKLEANIK